MKAVLSVHIYMHFLTVRAMTSTNVHNNGSTDVAKPLTHLVGFEKRLPSTSQVLAAACQLSVGEHPLVDAPRDIVLKRCVFVLEGKQDRVREAPALERAAGAEEVALPDLVRRHGAHEAAVAIIEGLVVAGGHDDHRQVDQTAVAQAGASRAACWGRTPRGHGRRLRRESLAALDV